MRISLTKTRKKIRATDSSDKIPKAPFFGLSVGPNSQWDAINKRTIKPARPRRKSLAEKLILKTGFKKHEKKDV
jgi:hypothetical protein